MAEDEVIEIVGARKEQAAEIASLIMEAMDYDSVRTLRAKHIR